MKKYLSALVLAVAVMLSISTANSQPYPSPTFQNLTILGTCTGCGGGGGGITSLTGPVTGSGTGAVATTITPTGVTAGSYTSANVTVNAAGQITFAANGSGGSGVSGPGSSVNNDVAAWNGTGGNTLLDTGVLYTNLATLIGTQTLTNKTLTGPTITSPSITGTISGSAAATFGAITGTTLNTTGGVTHSGLATSGTIGGSVCATSAGVLLYESGVNCESGGGSGTVTSIATTAPLSGGTITTSGTLSLTGPSNLTTFIAGTVPMGATTSPFVASEISDVGSAGVTIGSPTGGQKGAGTINMTGCFINNVACAAGGSGSVGSGTTNQIAGYASSGTAVGGVTVSGDFTLLGSTGVGTLATVNSNVGSFTNANITVNAKGLITAAANGSGGSGSPGGSNGQTQYNNSGAFGGYTPSGACTVVASTGVFTCFGSAAAALPATDLSGTLAAAQFPALTGDLTTTAGSLATTLATVNSNVGSFTNASVTVNAKGLITAASSGGGTQVAFSATTTNSSNAYTATLVPSSGCVLSNAPTLHVTFNAANTGAATLTGCGGTNVAIDGQTPTGLAALAGGEIAASNTERVLSYNTTAAVWVLANQLNSNVLNPCASQTFTAAQWASGLTCVVTSASQTFVFPVVSGLPSQGGIFINSVGQYFTVTPGTGDGVNGNTVSTNVTFGPGAYQASCLISGGTCEAAQTTSLAIAGGSRAIPLTVSWLSGQNLASPAAGAGLGNLKNTNGWVVSQVTCTPEVVVGGTATIDVYYAASGTLLASGTKIDTTSCNANTGAATDQAMLSAPVTVPAGDRIGFVASGAGWSASTGSGVLTVTLQQ